MGIQERHQWESSDEQQSGRLTSEWEKSDRLTVGQGLPGTAALGRLIRKSRTDQGLSASALATRVGVSPSYIRAIERGERAPAPAVAKDILGALDFAVEQADAGAGHQPDVVAQRGDHTLLIDFKHWTRAAAPVDLNSLAAIWSQLPGMTETRGAPIAAPAAGSLTGARTGLVEDEEDRARNRREPEHAHQRLEAASRRTGVEQDRGQAFDVALGRIVRQLSLLDHRSLELLAELIERCARGGTSLPVVLGSALRSLHDLGPDDGSGT